MKKNSYKLGLIIFLLFILYIGKCFSSSLFFNKKDRINLFFYGKKNYFVSLGVSDDVNYLGEIDTDWSIKVPGGYGFYKVGAIGKLSQLEKDENLIGRTFSLMNSNFIHYSFVPKDQEISYFKNKEDFNIGFSDFFNSKINSNANFFDKLYLYFKLSGKNKSNFIVINYLPYLDKNNQFSEEDFNKKYLGFFYQKKLREEGKNIQLIGQNYNSLKNLSYVIEGEGIRVVDISLNKEEHQKCIIWEDCEKEFSKTAQYLSLIFNCELKKDKIDIADILVDFGSNLEKKWTIK